MDHTEPCFGLLLNTERLKRRADGGSQPSKGCASEDDKAEVGGRGRCIPSDYLCPVLPEGAEAGPPQTHRDLFHTHMNPGLVASTNSRTGRSRSCNHHLRAAPRRHPPWPPGGTHLT
jgi:hypothetical protein